MVPSDRKYVESIRALREASAMTQTDVARILGTSQTMYARYERGANALPTRHLIQLSKFYHVSTDYILGLADK